MDKRNEAGSGQAKVAYIKIYPDNGRYIFDPRECEDHIRTMASWYCGFMGLRGAKEYDTPENSRRIIEAAKDLNADGGLDGKTGVYAQGALYLFDGDYACEGPSGRGRDGQAWDKSLLAVIDSKHGVMRLDIELKQDGNVAVSLSDVDIGSIPTDGKDSEIVVFDSVGEFDEYAKRDDPGAYGALHREILHDAADIRKSRVPAGFREAVGDRGDPEEERDDRSL